MKIEVGKTYPTRGGGTVRILATDAKIDQTYPVLGLVVPKGHTRERAMRYTPNGKVFNDHLANSMDILPEKKKAWVAIYSDGSAAGYGTLEETKRLYSRAIAYKEIEYYEGEGK